MRTVVEGGRVVGEAEWLWDGVPEWQRRHLSTDEFSPPPFPPLANDLG